MDAGELRYTVQIEAPARVTDAHGVTAITWIPFRTVKAAIQAAAGAETVVMGQVQATITHIVKMWYVMGLTTAMRISWPAENRKFQIVEIKQDSTFRRDMILKCVEVLEVE